MYHHIYVRKIRPSRILNTLPLRQQQVNHKKYEIWNQSKGNETNYNQIIHRDLTNFENSINIPEYIKIMLEKDIHRF